MANIYRAQNVTAYLIYELNESHHFVNNMAIQYLLSTVESKWQQTFGHSAFEEIVYAKEEGYTVKEVFEEYKVHGTDHIALPATEYYLQYGSFQLIERTYAIPNFTQEEIKLVQSALAQYRYRLFLLAS
ncbi:hypothetical protein FCT18_17660 [Lysinibacillus sphaericus]|uniref:Uncharacterized protein n=3 Tax=Lysinibacillus TaxID=400634 RepID=A0A2S0K5E0_LYSSH|nr:MULTISPECIES: hypothetical protein [Lysinibacillus]AHN20347.1 hypothetical protein T479_01935 [Lysinibacillus varians]AVK98595.1 hypothetical protein LS41612_20855 [Lysinibacillus sphaericus]MCS1381135.1 hypothetical protein [Lysinibacillus sphaericus]MED4544127.1 hypothetical protein [Lysinibacillus sphaericus]TKI17325.1 hypothetical protein FCT18_17660 [Lysinibacillus sphaericus]